MATKVGISNGALVGVEAPGLLAKVTGVDFTTSGDKQLLVVAAGETVLVTGYAALVTSATAATGDSSGISIGSNSSTYNDIFGYLSGFSSLTAANVFIADAGSSSAKVAAVGPGNIKMQIDTPDSGTTLVMTIYLFGYKI